MTTRKRAAAEAGSAAAIVMSAGTPPGKVAASADAIKVQRLGDRHDAPVRVPSSSPSR
ncbi:hypothetical protein [Actinoplanes sp. NPDC089786]|uniref:hypothetical protein n=1 Tax=Actinoplanes sp. NPDC089786 TaxID=3155185 RepID=UPI00341EF386